MEKAFMVFLTFQGTLDHAVMERLGKAGANNVSGVAIAGSMAVCLVTWKGNAHALWGRITKAGLVGLKEITVVACGDDWCGTRDKRLTGWMVRHLGDPAAWANES